MSIYSRVAAALATLDPVPFGHGTLLTEGEPLPDLYLVYNLVSGTPEEHADDAETERTYRIQVSIFSRDGLDDLPDVDAAMIAAGAMKGPERQLPRDNDTGHYGLAKDYTFQDVAEPEGS